MSDLVRRLAAHPRFEVRPGMLLSDQVAIAYRVVTVDGPGVWALGNDRGLGRVGRIDPGGMVPVLTDGPTIGALLDMLLGSTGWPRFGRTWAAIREY